MQELINKQSALSVCKEYGWIDDEDFVDGYNTAIKDMREAINELPTVEAEPVRCGRWENIPEMNNTVFCSECGAAADKYLAKSYKGCPFCLCVMSATDTNDGGK